MKNKKAFTLAEVLITILVIGIVVAITIPVLLTRINKKVDKEQKKVIEAKLIQGLNQADLNGEINNTYNSSYEFVKALSKHMKISAICDTDEISKCIPYDKITFLNAVGGQESINVSEINSAEVLRLHKIQGRNFMAPVSFIMGNGTPVIMSYDKDCVSDPDSIKEDNRNIHSCVAGLYDLNAANNPNAQGSNSGKRIDIIPFNGAGLGCEYLIKGVCVEMLPFEPTPVMCSEVQEELGITTCRDQVPNYYLGAYKKCKDLGYRLPSGSDMTKLLSASEVDNSIESSFLSDKGYSIRLWSFGGNINTSKYGAGTYLFPKRCGYWNDSALYYQQNFILYDFCGGPNVKRLSICVK